jgi:hypothetical protein
MEEASGMADDFRALMDSLGNMALSAIREHASQVRVTADPVLCTAHVVALMDELPADDEYDAVLGRLVELHDFYTDELSLSFAIEKLRPGADEQNGHSTEVREFAYSG